VVREYLDTQRAFDVWLRPEVIRNRFATKRLRL
jgi:hypothetical protein